MADLRVAVQTKIIEAVKAGTFKVVEYDDATHYPIEPTSTSVPKSIICNEVSAGLSNSAAYSSRADNFVLRDWRFECIVEFNKEITFTSFVQQVRTIRFTTEEGLKAEITFGDVQAEHPVRQGAQSGTRLIFGLTVQTRR